MILLELIIILMLIGIYIGKAIEWYQFMKRFDKLETLVQQRLSAEAKASTLPDGNVR